MSATENNIMVRNKQPFSVVNENELLVGNRRRNDPHQPFDEKDLKKKSLLQHTKSQRGVPEANSPSSSPTATMRVKQQEETRGSPTMAAKTQKDRQQADDSFNRAMGELRDMLDSPTTSGNTTTNNSSKRRSPSNNSNSKRNSPPSSSRISSKSSSSSVSPPKIKRHLMSRVLAEEGDEAAGDENNEQVETIMSNEKEATRKLKKVDDVLSTVKQELEELRFFHEIDIEDSSAASPNRRKTMTPIVSKKMSPRRLAAMDRSALEYELQDLQRKYDSMYQERDTLQKKVQNYEHLSKSRTEEGNRIRSMEHTIDDVQSIISTQVDNINHNRNKLASEYNTQLSIANERNIQLWEESGNLATEIIALKRQHASELEKLMELLEKTSEKLNSKETENEMLQLDIEERDMELDAFKKDLADNLILLQDRDYEYKELERRHNDTLLDVEAKQQSIQQLEVILDKEQEKVKDLKATVEEYVEKEDMKSLLCSWGK